MHRRAFLESLADYAFRHPEERGVASRFSNFVAAHLDCFERKLEVGHVTGSAWIVSADGARVLLTHHRKLGKWLQPGGHVDGNSDVAREAGREAREETGLADLAPLSGAIFDVDIHEIPENKNKGEAAHFHYDARYVFRARGSENFTVSEESHDLAWVGLEEIAKYTREESVLRLARKWESLKKAY